MDFIFDFSAWVGTASLQSSLLALALWLVYTARKTSALFGIQYVLGILIIARLCIPATPSFEGHPFNLIKTSPTQVESAHSTPNNFTQRTIQNAEKKPSTNVHDAALFPPSSILEKKREIEWQTLLSFLWAIGFCIGLVRFLIAQIRHHSLLKSCEPLEHQRIEDTVRDIRDRLRIRQPIQLLKSQQIGSAAVTGTLHPKLIVSPHFIRELSDQQQRHVLMHEMVHIKRFDPLVNRVTLMLQAIHWFNPLVQWALRKFQQDRELVCDAIAIKTLGESHRSAYGETLIEILTSFRNQRSFPNLVPIISNKHEIKRRIMMISMNQSTPSRRPILLIAGLLVVLAVTFTRPASVKAQSSSDENNVFHHANSGSAAIGVEGTLTLSKVDFATPSATRIKLRDVSSQGSGNGVLVAPGSGKQMYNVHEIDVTSFPSGGILLVDITMGDGESAGSFDLFPEGVALPSGSPEGSVARNYDMPPGATRTMVYQFAKGQVFRFGASGNWFSEKGTTNDFQFEARAVPMQSANGVSTTETSVPAQHFGFDFEAGTPVFKSITTSSSGAVNEITLGHGAGTTVELVSEKHSDEFGTKAKAVKGKHKVTFSGGTIMTADGNTATFHVAPNQSKISPKATGFVTAADGTVTTYTLVPNENATSSVSELNIEFDAKKKVSKEAKASN